MKNRKNQRGFVLFLVSGIALILLAGLVGLFYILNASVRNLGAFKERIVGYYLCETGASVAMLDITHGCIGDPGKHETAPTACPNVNSGEKWKERTIAYYFDGNTHQITYTIEKAEGRWRIVSKVGKKVDSSGLFTRTYTLEVGGLRGFLIFILRGFSGK